MCRPVHWQIECADRSRIRYRRIPGGVLTEKSYITCYFAEAGLRRIQISILMLVTAIIMWRYKKD